MNLSRAFSFSSILLVVSLVVGSTVDAQTTWDGSTGDTFWFTDANWDTGVAPNSATAIAIVGAPSPTVVNSTALLQSLTVTADGVVNVGISQNLNFAAGAVTSLTNAGVVSALNNSDLQVLGMVDNSGSINITSVGNQTDLEVATGGATLTGGGTVTLSGNFAGINDATGTQTLTIADQTIQGVGSVGRDTTNFDNQANGLVDANVNGGILQLDAVSLFTNSGTLRASNGGILELNDGGAGDYANAGGTIEALAGSEVRLLSGARIIGGVVSTTGTGVVRSAISANVEFVDLTLNGDFIAGNNSDTRITGTIVNTGTIEIASTGNQTDLEVAVGGATLTGGGTVTLTGIFAGINDASGTQTLTIADQTIQGRGNIGRNTSDVINQAGNLVHANVAAEILEIDVVSLFTNAGTLRASNGGVLQLNDGGVGDFANAGGTIEALAGSEVRLLSGARIIGGVVSTTGTGVVRSAISANVEFVDLTLNGDFIAGNNSDTRITGTIVNTGTIEIASTGNQTDLEVAVGGATLTGGGTVTLTGIFAGINDASGTQTLTIADQTIQGRGNIGRNTSDVINQAGNLVHANVAAEILEIDVVSLFTNAGTLRASNGGVLQLNDGGVGDFANAGGTIEALAGSEVRLLSGARIIGGVVSTTGTGVVRSAISANVEFVDLTLNGDFIAGNNSDTRITGTIVNTGTIEIASTGNQTDLEVAVGGATLTGGGTVTLTGTFAGINDASGTQTLTIADQTIQGRGNIGRNTTAIINTADGTILANAPGGNLTIDVHAPDFSNDGVLAVDGATINVVGNLMSSATAVLRGEGTIAASGGSIEHAGEISPGASAGTLVLDASVTLLGAANLDIEVGGLTAGTEFDLVAVNGTLALAGDLSLSLLGGFLPDASDTFEIVTSSGISGAFANVANGGALLSDDGMAQFTVNYGAGSAFDPNSVVLSDFVDRSIPEPTSLTLLLASGLLLAGRRAASRRCPS